MSKEEKEFRDDMRKNAKLMGVELTPKESRLPTDELDKLITTRFRQQGQQGTPLFVHRSKEEVEKLEKMVKEMNKKAEEFQEAEERRQMEKEDKKPEEMTERERIMDVLISKEIKKARKAAEKHKQEAGKMRKQEAEERRKMESEDPKKTPLTLEDKEVQAIQNIKSRIGFDNWKNLAPEDKDRVIEKEIAKMEGKPAPAPAPAPKPAPKGKEPAQEEADAAGDPDQKPKSDLQKTAERILPSPERGTENLHADADRFLEFKNERQKAKLFGTRERLGLQGLERYSNITERFRNPYSKMRENWIEDVNKQSNPFFR
jgi:hypothetical protein